MDFNAMAQWLMSQRGHHGGFLGLGSDAGREYLQPGTPGWDAYQKGDVAGLAAYLQSNASVSQSISGDQAFQGWNLTNQQSNQLQSNQKSQQQILQNMQQYAQELQKPLDPNDPLYKSVMSAAANAGGGAAEAQGINGPLAGANVAAATAGAFANTEMERQSLAAQVYGQGGQLALGGGNLALQGYQTGVQQQYNAQAQADAQNPFNYFSKLAGTAVGAVTGRAIGGFNPSGNTGTGQSVSGLVQAPAGGGVPLTPGFAPQQQMGDFSGGGFSRGAA